MFNGIGHLLDHVLTLPDLTFKTTGSRGRSKIDIYSEYWLVARTAESGQSKSIAK
jgi:hypothetical protein